MRKMRHFKFLLGISLIGTYLSALPGCVSIPVAGVVQVDHKAQALSLYKAGKSLKLAEITAESAVDLGIIQKGSLVALAVADALDKAKTSYDLAVAIHNESKLGDFQDALSQMKKHLDVAGKGAYQVK
ncbi:hypothetical protein [Parvimonas sp. D9]|uniref:hypothetical protein n=1 Tax=Parvimonas sp. D9 TaxID=3110689 RepID=UPI002B47614E|nr:hypothetical protein [Parvimonas sp. D9]MEB3059315.1 hypothetical protein [Parvimonas sp. D9]